MGSLNEFGQPVGQSMPGWAGVARPAAAALTGHHVSLEPLAAEHVPALFQHLCGPDDRSLWTYRSDEMPASLAQLAELVASAAATTYAVVPTAGEAHGMTSLLRDDPANGSIEVGSVIYSRDLQRTAAGTEATYLLARHVFGLGYRRLEWKLDSLNVASARSARRLGFREEGTFRQHRVYKGRSRDTQWFALTDRDWARVRPLLEGWLDPDNFDGSGQQRRRLVVPAG